MTRRSGGCKICGQPRDFGATLARSAGMTHALPPSGRPVAARPARQQESSRSLAFVSLRSGNVLRTAAACRRRAHGGGPESPPSAAAKAWRGSSSTREALDTPFQARSPEMPITLPVAGRGQPIILRSRPCPIATPARVARPTPKRCTKLPGGGRGGMLVTQRSMRWTHALGKL